MQKKTIIKLNQLNQDFYKTVATSFDETRQHSWLGWKQLLLQLDRHFTTADKIVTIDLGCGNGRLASFLQQNFLKEFFYLGIDTNPRLLEKALARLSTASIPHAIHDFDFIAWLINAEDEVKTSILSKKISQYLRAVSPELTLQPKLITLFGVWHHLPSHQLRQQLLNNLDELMARGDLLVIATWNFAREERFAKKTILPAKIDLPAEELETGDYILDWQRGKSAYRYCHYSPIAEMMAHFRNSNLRILHRFEADGKSERLNSYYLLTKIVKTQLAKNRSPLKH